MKKIIMHLKKFIMTLKNHNKSKNHNESKNRKVQGGREYTFSFPSNQDAFFLSMKRLIWSANAKISKNHQRINLESYLGITNREKLEVEIPVCVGKNVGGIRKGGEKGVEKEVEKEVGNQLSVEGGRQSQSEGNGKQMLQDGKQFQIVPDSQTTLATPKQEANKQEATTRGFKQDSNNKEEANTLSKQQEEANTLSKQESNTLSKHESKLQEPFHFGVSPSSGSVILRPELDTETTEQGPRELLDE
jgi:hypothetical protein